MYYWTVIFLLNISECTMFDSRFYRFTGCWTSSKYSASTGLFKTYVEHNELNVIELINTKVVYMWYDHEYIGQFSVISPMRCLFGNWCRWKKCAWWQITLMSWVIIWYCLMKSKMRYSQNWKSKTNICQKENKNYKFDKFERLYENLQR